MTPGRGLIMRVVFSIVLVVLLAVCAAGQLCPTGRSTEGVGPSVLRGTVVYHDELHPWLSLKLDRPACGETEMQLVYAEADKYKFAKSLQGCTVNATGTIYEGVSGYYSARLAMQDPLLSPSTSCQPHVVEPDLSQTRIPADINSWQATITVDYRGKGHVDVSVWQSADHRVQLKPWQAYVNYILTGTADVIWFKCRNGFHIGESSSSPPGEALPNTPETMGITLRNLNGVNKVNFTCRR
jgi:hypothetical protein